MTTTQTIRNLKGAVSDAEDTINDLARKVEDLEIENQRLNGDLDVANDDVSALQGRVNDLEDSLKAAPGLRPEER